MMTVKKGKFVVTALLALFLSGCGLTSYAGFYRLGDKQTLSDGTILEAFAGKTPGHSGPDITFAQTYRCPKDGECEMNANYNAGAPGLVESASVGFFGAAATAAGNAGAGYFISKTKPARINETTTVSGVSGDINASSNAQQQQQQQQQQTAHGGDADITVPPIHHPKPPHNPPHHKPPHGWWK